MTPFGVKLRQLRQERGTTLKDMADQLGVSAAYLSALEHGRRGRPTHAMVVAICAQLNIIWDEADELMRLARLSHPRVTVDTAGLSPAATERTRQSPRRAHPQTAARAHRAAARHPQDDARRTCAPAQAAGRQTRAPLNPFLTILCQARTASNLARGGTWLPTTPSRSTRCGRLICPICRCSR
jgi:transcriptional regulator with XRE-family HTH domain